MRGASSHFNCSSAATSRTRSAASNWTAISRAPVCLFSTTRSRPGVRIDEETIQSLHEALGSKVGSRLFIIAPALTFDFQQDYLDLDGVRYYALRIPYSIIHELHQREFTALKQPSDELAVNDTVEAVGFDFIRTPELEYDVRQWQTEGRAVPGGVHPHQDLQERGGCARAMAEERQPRNAFDGDARLRLRWRDVFDLDAVFYADAIEKAGWEVRFPLESLGQQVMAVFVDIYGNEARELIPAERFGSSAEARLERKQRRSRRRRGVSGTMTTRGDRRTFRNEDLVLKVSTNIDPNVWDESKYEAFLDELCGSREYQKESIRTTLRYLLGGKYANLHVPWRRTISNRTRN